MRQLMSIHLLICISVRGHNCSDVPASHLGSTNCSSLPLTETSYTSHKRCWPMLQLTTFFFFFSRRKSMCMNRAAWAWELTPRLPQVIPDSSLSGGEFRERSSQLPCLPVINHLDFTKIPFSLSLKREHKSSISNQNENLWQPSKHKPG